MQSKVSSSNNWGNVDGATSPDFYVRFLDATRAEASKAIQANPQRYFADWEVQPGFQILDVGCGTGDLIWPVARLVGSTGQVIGVDISQTMIAQARERTAGLGLPLDFRQGDATQLDFAAASFDVCNANFLLMHLDDPRQALLEMARVTRLGGLVSVLDNDWETFLFAGTDRALTRRILNAYCDSIRHGWIGRDLPGLFNDCGLTAVVVRAATRVRTQMPENSYFHPAFVVRKALNSGAVSQAEADEWLQDQEQRMQENRFFHSITSFRVMGRRV